MSKFIAISLICFLLFADISKLVLIGNYIIDFKKYEVDCINKKEKSFSCNGLCQLSKEIKQQSEEKDESPNLPISAMSVFLSPFVFIHKTQMSFQISEKIIPFHWLQSAYNFFFYTRLLKPPITQ